MKIDSSISTVPSQPVSLPLFRAGAIYLAPAAGSFVYSIPTTVCDGVYLSSSAGFLDAALGSYLYGRFSDAGLPMFSVAVRRRTKIFTVRG